MPHIALPESQPGIRGAMAFRPETASPLNDLVEVLLRAPNSLSPGERELIATYVSYLNDCHYCQSIHGAIAAAHLDGDEELVRRVKADFQYACHIGKAEGARLSSQAKCSVEASTLQQKMWRTRAAWAQRISRSMTPF